MLFTPHCHKRRFCRRNFVLRLQIYCAPSSGKYARQIVTTKRVFSINMPLFKKREKEKER